MLQIGKGHCDAVATAGDEDATAFNNGHVAWCVL